MTGTKLGKITIAEIGLDKDRPCFYGLHLQFAMKDTGIGDGGLYTYYIKWNENDTWSKEERAEWADNTNCKIADLLKEAKVNYVSQLVNKPVEITIQDNLFKSFRILTEVL